MDRRTGESYIPPQHFVWRGYNKSFFHQRGTTHTSSCGMLIPLTIFTAVGLNGADIMFGL